MVWYILLSFLTFLIAEINSQIIQKCCSQNELLDEWYECALTKIAVSKLIKDKCASTNQCRLLPMEHLQWLESQVKSR